jgi:glutaredoxin
MTFVLIGPKRCPNCDEFGAKLTELDIPWEKVILDPALHESLVEQAKSAGYMEAPVICLKDESGALTYVAAGLSPFAERTTRKAYNALVPVG